MPHTESAHPIDPYRNYRFRVKWDGHYVAGVSHVSALVWDAEVVEIREGGDPGSIRKVPGQIKFPPITLNRGLTTDTAFEDWANMVRNAGSGGALANYHKDIVIDLFDEAGHKVLSYKVYRCWVSEYEAFPDLDAHPHATAIEHLRLENEGWERDHTVVPPSTSSHRTVERRKH